MGLGKILRKVGKGVKKAAPLALLALGAAALAKRRKAKALNAIIDHDVSGGDTGTLSGKAGFEGDVPSAPAETKGLGKTDKVEIVPLKKPKKKIDHGTAYQSSRAAGNYPDYKPASKDDWSVGRQNLTNTDPTPYLKKKVITTPPEAVTGFKKKSVIPSWARRAAQNWRYKSGGRVGVGKAKRGFGRALRKK